MNPSLSDEYISLALSSGAKHAVMITPEEIVFDGRTLLKCMFGCDDWGMGPTCPSRAQSLKPWEYEVLLKKYTSVLVIHTQEKHLAQKISLMIEKVAYYKGDVFAFSMSDCALCEECVSQKGDACRNVLSARPAFHSVGIDVFTTVHKLGLPLKPLEDETEIQNWYAAVWLNL